MNVARPARQRDEREIAQRLRTVALVQIQMTLLLDDDPARPSGKHAHGDAVGQRARGHENRALLAEQARELGLELLDDTTDRVGVGADAALLGESREQARVPAAA